MLKVRCALTSGLAVLVCLAAYGQDAAPHAAFEVASVKPSQRDTPVRVSGGPGTSDPTRWTCSKCSLWALLTQGYGVLGYQVASPDWMQTAYFDITAKVPAGTSRADFRLMIQGLLEERFKLAAHRENREMPVYELVTGKNGAKLEEVSEPVPAPAPGPALDKDGFPNVPGGTGVMRLNGRGRIQFRAQTMDGLARVLSGVVERPVLDATGLKGKYALTLSWYLTGAAAPLVPLAGNGLPAPIGAPRNDADSGPTIFKAMQDQLGLRLEPKKGMIEMLVVDHSEKVPIEN